MTVGGFFKGLGNALKHIFTNPQSVALGATVADIIAPQFKALTDSAAAAIINAEGQAIAAGVQSGTGAQKFAYALAQFGPIYTQWAKQNNVQPSNEHAQAILQKTFELWQLAPELFAAASATTQAPAPTPSTNVA